MSEFGPQVREQLHAWFVRYGNNQQFEIEARIRDVTELGFKVVEAKLSSNKAWSNRPQPIDSLDLLHATGVRETRSANGAPPTFLRKQKHEHYDVYTGERSVRFAVASEVPTPQDTSPVRTYRYKQRVTFEHKRTFKFELTRVKQGDSERGALAAEEQHEIEIEYC